MGESPENLINGKYTKEDVEFFDALVKKYNLEQNEENLILIKKNGDKTFFPKWRTVPTKTRGRVDVEVLIKEELENE